MKLLDTSCFRPISLEQMDGVKLMSRTDTKFCATMDQLNELFQKIQPHYYALTMDGENQLPYETTYFDTPSANMYSNHVRGKKNRYKIRRRTYLSTGIHFLEIKFKNNKGRTIKERISTPVAFDKLSGNEQNFLSQNTPFDPTYLKPGLQNSFLRITLVNKNFKERCTIDFNLQFTGKDETVLLKDLAIIELKTGDRNNQSELGLALRELRIRPSGFSKYAMGRSLVDEQIKSNAIRPQLRNLYKLSRISFLTHQLTSN
nr:polyphosphate polymerase domain-containing protein [uncultured Carboxylicivirga sp.]